MALSQLFDTRVTHNCTNHTISYTWIFLLHDLWAQQCKFLHQVIKQPSVLCIMLLNVNWIHSLTNKPGLELTLNVWNDFYSIMTGANIVWMITRYYFLKLHLVNCDDIMTSVMLLMTQHYCYCHNEWLPFNHFCNITVACCDQIGRILPKCNIYLNIWAPGTHSWSDNFDAAYQVSLPVSSMAHGPCLHPLWRILYIWFWAYVAGLFRKSLNVHTAAYVILV